MTRAVRALTLLLAATTGGLSAPRQTALDRYVAAPDPSYKFELINTIESGEVTAYVLDLTSQTWRTPQEVDKPVWKHWLTIMKPSKVKYDTGFLFITGGSSTTKAPTQPDAMLRNIAEKTGSVVAELRMVPNQALTFAGESKGRVEDAMIAWTWDKFLKGGDDNWPARLPMTKSAVRAMDAVTAFCASDKGGKVKVGKFVVAGASKRGWTTWTTAAADKRVVAIVPLVIDVLNVRESMDHHYRAYGFWSPAIRDYNDMGLERVMRTPRYDELMKIEDPWEYRDRLTMPKYIINAAGDQYFLPDSWQFYWNDLKGEKHLRYVPNADHSLRGSDVADSLLGFYQEFLEGKTRPRFDWSAAKDGTLRVKAKDHPTAVKLWQATNPEARDFRLEKIGPAWKESPLAESKPGEYEARVQAPAKGFTAYMIELTYANGSEKPVKFTTGVKVVPDILPFELKKTN